MSERRGRRLAEGAARRLVDSRLVLVTGLAAALPIVVATVRAVHVGWLPTGDDALIAVRAYDVFSSHPPLVGQISLSSSLIDAPVSSPGPMLYWLVAIPARLGGAAPVVAMGLVNVAAVVGVVGLARRRAGVAFMFAVAVALAVMCRSLDAPILRDIWNPHAALLPFTLLIFLAWSLACGDWRLLPLVVVVASFVVQCHLAYVLPSAALLAVCAGFLFKSRVRVERRWLVGAVVAAVVCWSLPLAAEVVHRPGNLERIAQAGTTHTPRFGLEAGLRGVARTVGVAPWWLRSPRSGFDRLADVAYGPGGAQAVTCMLVIAGLCWLVIAGLRRGRRDLASAALLGLTLLTSLATFTAVTPNNGKLFAVITYTLWWASPVGMFCWLVLGWGALVLARPHLRKPPRTAPTIATAVALLGLTAAAVAVSAAEQPERIERAFAPAHRLFSRVRNELPEGHTFLITGSITELGNDFQAGLAYALRADGRRFVASTLPGIGSRYDASRRSHDLVLSVLEAPPRLPPGSRVLARVRLARVPADPRRPDWVRARDMVVTLGPAGTKPAAQGSERSPKQRRSSNEQQRQ